MGTHPIFESDFDCLTVLETMSKFIAIIGFILMLHSAVSIGQYRGIMRERGDDDFTIPFDIILECLIGLFLAAYGWTQELATYQDISSDVTMQKKSIEALLYRPGFYTRVTRRWDFYDEIDQ